MGRRARTATNFGDSLSLRESEGRDIATCATSGSFLVETMALMYPVADVLRELLKAWIAIAASKLQDAGLE